MNKKNFKKILNRIKTNPECWDQTDWHCGTQHCFFGWAQIETGKKPNNKTVRRDARIFLDISLREANYLSSPYRTLEDFEKFLNQGFYDEDGIGLDGYDRDSYDRDGYDQYSYDRDGYDPDGFDRNGFDRNGFDRNGYARDGYNQSGYDRYGYDRYGYDRNGYDQNGYDRDGYDQNGYDRDGYDPDGFDLDGLGKNNKPKTRTFQKRNKK